MVPRRSTWMAPSLTTPMSVVVPPDVEHDQMPQAVVGGQGAGALQAAARAGAVGLERRGLRYPGRAAVVAEDPQRLAGPGVPQPPVGVEQEPLHRRVQERVEQAGPGAADVVGVGHELPGEQQRDRAEQMPGVEPSSSRLTRASSCAPSAPLTATTSRRAPRADRSLTRARSSRLSSSSSASRLMTPHRSPTSAASRSSWAWVAASPPTSVGSVTSRPSCGPVRCTRALVPWVVEYRMQSVLCSSAASRGSP